MPSGEMPSGIMPPHNRVGGCFLRVQVNKRHLEGEGTGLFSWTRRGGVILGPRTKAGHLVTWKR